MRSPQSVLESLQKQSHKTDYQFERLYRNLYNPEFYLLAYGSLYANKGSMTPGVDGKTLDGMGMERINALIEKLRDQSYKPQPAKRRYIPKNNGGLRPLGIPAADDKLVQEVVRMLLESIYEPTFSKTSHGFRPNKSCHTALAQVQKQFTGVKWFVEGDIKGFFDNIDHHTLVGILRRRIRDESFISLIWKFLKAGYMEDWFTHQTYSGTPQGSGVSPVLANIYLNELDKFIEEYKSSFDKGEQRGHNQEYVNANRRYHLQGQRYQAIWEKLSDDEKRLARKRLKALLQSYRHLPTKDLMDPNYRRIQYARYADDFIIGAIGSKADAEQVKAVIGQFLSERLKLTLSQEKTLITHGQDKARFLGYDVTICQDTAPVATPKGIVRAASQRVRLLLPKDKWMGKLLEYGALKIETGPDGKERWMPVARNEFLNKDAIEILSLYNAEIRGIYNYYRMANNVSVLSKFRYVMEYSMYKTLAGKLRTSMSKIKQKYMRDGVFGIEYATKTGIKRATFFHDGFRRNKLPLMGSVDLQPDYRDVPRPSELLARLAIGSCEMCRRSDKPVVVHQVKCLKDLKGATKWEQLMRKKRRKTLILCEDCHEQVHPKL